MAKARSELPQTPASDSSSHKRRGTRSVSTLTPSQLARKRANDREAQRAIRARTKEHIERLEKELEDLRSQQSRDQTIQELTSHNKALADELYRLKQTMNVPSSFSSAAGGPPANTSPQGFTPGTNSSAASCAATSPMVIVTTPTLERAGASQVISCPPDCDGAETSPSRGYSNAGIIPSAPAHAVKMEVDDRDRGTLVAHEDPLRVYTPGRGRQLPHHQIFYGAAMPDPNSFPGNNNADGSDWGSVPNASSLTLQRPSSSADDYTTAGGATYMTTNMHDSMIPREVAVVKMEFGDGGPDLNNDSLQPQFQQHYHQADLAHCSANLSYTSPLDPPPGSIPWDTPPIYSPFSRDCQFNSSVSATACFS